MESLYEQEITELLDSLRSRLSSSSPSLSDPVFEDAIRHDINRLNLTIRQLEAEARGSASAATRAALQERVKQLKREAKAVEKSSLVGATIGNGDSENGRLAGEDRVEAMQGKLDRATESLENSHRVMQELEESAVDVSSQLKQNRETLVAAHDKLRKTGAVAGQARSLLSRMENRRVRQKVIIYFICGIVAFVLLFLMYKSIF